MAWKKLSEALESALSDMLEKGPEAVTPPASQREEVNKEGKSSRENLESFANGTHTRSAPLRLVVNNRCEPTHAQTPPQRRVGSHLWLAADHSSRPPRMRL